MGGGVVNGRSAAHTRGTPVVLAVDALGDVSGDIRVLAHGLSDRASTPEQALLVAVIEQAMRDLLLTANGPRAARLRDEAAQWFASTDREWPLSFERACEELNLDVVAFRCKLEELQGVVQGRFDYTRHGRRVGPGKVAA